ncbi:MAG: S41 family peptidase [Reichenbachiella sp.]|uniref:S41 family peptidase n=1 Tax=Reichenbachiella sp. TaxID=2184521 RepID=UPI0032649A42
MKQIIIGLIILLTIPYGLFAQEYSQGDIKKIELLDRKLSISHVEYESIRPIVQHRIVDEFVSLIDPDRLLLTVEVIDELRRSIPSDRELELKSLNGFLNQSFELYQRQSQGVEMFLDTLGNLDFFEEDSIYFQIQFDSINFASNTADLYDFWQRDLKLRVLQKIADNDSLINSDDQEINHRLNNKMRTLLEAEKCKLESRKSNLRSFIFNCLMRAYAKSFDPHSDFFSPDGQERLLSALSNQTYSTGLLFENLDSKFVITNILPFSHASTLTSIKVGDEIVAINLNSVSRPMQCLSFSEIHAAFYGRTSDVITVEIRSAADRSFRTYTLKKKEVENVDNHIYNLILHKEDRNIGYVFFPSFYSDLVAGTKSSGQDLTLILLELNKKNIDGLIIDLRNNGGGSLQEAVDLSGFFIDYGPLFMITDRQSREGLLFKDTKRGQIYKGKVIFLVNAYSASASELVVSAMRHYPNQLVVGATTFGKSTGQTLYRIQQKSNSSHVGLAKITTMRMHNINGGSYQQTGVIPDIELPFFPSKKIVGEGTYRHALKSKTVSKSFRPRQARNVPVKELREMSASRIKQDTVLLTMQNQYDSLERMLTQGFGQSLKYDQYSNEYTLLDDPINISSEFESIGIEVDKTYEANNELLKESTKKDPILNEVFRIFEDWIDYE